MPPTIGRGCGARTHRLADVTHPHTHASNDLDGHTCVIEWLTGLVPRHLAPSPVLGAGRPTFALCSPAVSSSTARVRLGGSSSAARVHPCRGSCRGATPPAFITERSSGAGGVAARWEVWQPSGAPSREGHRPDHHPTLVTDSLTRGKVGSSEAGARVQGGAPGPRRAVETSRAPQASVDEVPRRVVQAGPERGVGAPHGSKTGVRACPAQRSGHRRRPGAGGNLLGGVW